MTTLYLVDMGSMLNFRLMRLNQYEISEKKMDLCV